MAFQRKSHCKFLIVYHLIFVVKYRKPLLVRYGMPVKTYFQDRAAQSDFSIKELEVDRDHVHLLVSSPPPLAPAQIVRWLKQESSRRLWRHYPELRQEAIRLLTPTLGVPIYSENDPSELSARLSEPDRVSEVLAELYRSNITVASFSFSQPSLDEVFLTLTGHKAETDENNVAV